MPPLTRQPLRLALDLEQSEKTKLTLGKTTPHFWRGNDIDFEIAVFKGFTLLDISSLASMTLDLFKLDKTNKKLLGAPLLSQTLAAGQLNAALTPETWKDGSAQHAQFTFTHDETWLDLGSDPEQLFGLRVYGITSNVPIERILFGTALVKVIDGGDYDEIPPIVAENNGSYRLKNKTEFQLFDSGATPGWRTLLAVDGGLALGPLETT